MFWVIFRGEGTVLLHKSLTKLSGKLYFILSLFKRLGWLKSVEILKMGFMMKKEEKEKLTWMHIQQSWLDGSCSDDQDKWIFWNWTDILSWWYLFVTRANHKNIVFVLCYILVSLILLFYIFWKVIIKEDCTWSSLHWIIIGLSRTCLGFYNKILHLFGSCNLIILGLLHFICSVLVNCCLGQILDLHGLFCTISVWFGFLHQEIYISFRFDSISVRN